MIDLESLDQYSYDIIINVSHDYYTCYRWSDSFKSPKNFSNEEKCLYFNNKKFQTLNQEFFFSQSLFFYFITSSIKLIIFFQISFFFFKGVYESMII